MRTGQDSSRRLCILVSNTSNLVRRQMARSPCTADSIDFDSWICSAQCVSIESLHIIEVETDRQGVEAEVGFSSLRINDGSACSGVKKWAVAGNGGYVDLCNIYATSYAPLECPASIHHGFPCASHHWNANLYLTTYPRELVAACFSAVESMNCADRLLCSCNIPQACTIL